MILKIKAFIYRFSDIFGLRIYLANKEEKEFLKNTSKRGTKAQRGRSLSIGIWQAANGFTTVYTRNMSMPRAIIAKVKHAFDFKVFGE
jgi:hypothetical protein